MARSKRLSEGTKEVYGCVVDGCINIYKTKEGLE